MCDAKASRSIWRIPHCLHSKNSFFLWASNLCARSCSNDEHNFLQSPTRHVVPSLLWTSFMCVESVFACENDLPHLLQGYCPQGRRDGRLAVEARSGKWGERALKDGLCCDDLFRWIAVLPRIVFGTEVPRPCCRWDRTLRGAIALEAEVADRFSFSLPLLWRGGFVSPSLRINLSSCFRGFWDIVESETP